MQNAKSACECLEDFGADRVPVEERLFDTPFLIRNSVGEIQVTEKVPYLEIITITRGYSMKAFEFGDHLCEYELAQKLAVRR